MQSSRIAPPVRGPGRGPNQACPGPARSLGRANLETAFYILAGVCIPGLIIYYLVASCYFGRVSREESEAPEPARVSIIVPATGDGAFLRPGLESILAQDYRDFKLLIPVEAESDPAWPIVLDLAQTDPRITPLLAGEALSCGQKNKNLLAALEHLEPRTEILVFVDAGRMAEPGFLRNLIAPLTAGRAGLVSGYHHFLPQSGNPAGSGKALNVLILALARNIPVFHRAWGGATALDAETRGRLNLGRAWAHTVVDDAVLAQKSLAAKQVVTKMVKPQLTTLDQGETWGSWRDWLTRQIAFFKTILPGDWVAVGLLALVLSLLLFSSPAWIAAWAFWSGPAGPAAAGGLFLFCYFFLTALIRRLHPGPGSLACWFLACAAFLPMVLFCFVQTCLTDRISWRGRVYRVGRGGRVKGVSRI